MDGYTQTTAEITIDLPAACCISTALQDDITRLERARGRARNAKTIERIDNTLANTRRALAAFDPVYAAALKAPLFTPEYQELMDTAASARRPK